MNLRKIRTLLALLFFLAITLLFLDFTGTVRPWFGWMAKVQFLPAVLAANAVVVVALLALTLVFGRIYCSVICPLGVFQDVAARLGRIGKRNPYHFSHEKHVLRYAVLTVFCIALILGVPAIVTLLAPYSSYGRIAQNLFQPIYEFGNNLLAMGAEHVDSYAFYRTDVWVRSGVVMAVAAATFLIVGFLAWRGGRTYCNTICPVGTFLSIFARFSWFRIAFDPEKCRKCSLCSKNCKAAAIDFKSMTVDYSRCVVCGDCLEHCRFDSLHYVGHKRYKVLQKAGQDAAQPNHKSQHANLNSQSQESRRHFLLAAALATTAAAKAQKDKKVDGGMAKIIDKEAPKRETPITPPGSLSAENMAKHCTACQLCVAECPNGVLRPSTSLGTFMQPTMSYERGYCRPECTRCSKVCPTGAIKPITRAEKSTTHVGHAVWVKKNCVPVTDGVECGNCARHCPVGAIMMVPLDPKDELSPLVPAVAEWKCIGCGACENLCPARPFSAIYVEGHEVHERDGKSQELGIRN